MIRVDASGGHSITLSTGQLYAVRKAYQILIFYVRGEEPIQLPVDDREELADLYEQVVEIMVPRGLYSPPGPTVVSKRS